MPDPSSVPVPDGFPVPIGLRLNQAARAVGRAFDEALAQAGGSLPVWLILLNLKTRKPGPQRELAEAIGISEATLTHHLNAMDADGLITRARDAANRRIQVVTLTGQGDRAFLALRAAAVAFDARLRAGLAESDLATLATLLARLSANVAALASEGPAGAAPAGEGPAVAAPAGEGPAVAAPAQAGNARAGGAQAGGAQAGGAQAGNARAGGAQAGGAEAGGAQAGDGPRGPA